MTAAYIKVGEIAEQIRGVTYSKGDASDSAAPGFTPVLRAGNIDDDGLSFDDLVFVPKEKISSKQFILRGDVLIATSSGSLDVVGKAAIAQENFDGSFGAFCKVVRPNTARVVPGYLGHYFRTQKYRRTVSSLAAGANINNLRDEHIDNLLVRLPSFEEQRRISAILDKADELRAKRKEALALLDSMAQSIFVDMFGSPISNSMNWPQLYLREIGRIVTGNTPPREVAENYGDAIEWIKSDNLSTPHYWATKAVEGLSEFGKKRARVVPPSSILVTCIAGSPESIGNCAITNREVAFRQPINALVPTRGNSHFLYAQFKVGKKLIQNASTNGMKGLVSKGKFEEIRFIFPPIELQDLFAKRVLSIKALRDRQQSAFDATQELMASLQHRAFHGEL